MNIVYRDIAPSGIAVNMEMAGVTLKFNMVLAEVGNTRFYSSFTGASDSSRYPNKIGKEQLNKARQDGFYDMLLSEQMRWAEENKILFGYEAFYFTVVAVLLAIREAEKTTGILE